MSTVGNSRSVLENPMDWRAWRATVNGITKNLTRLKWPGMDAHRYVLWFWGAVCWTHQRVPAQAVCLRVLSRFSRLGLFATLWTVARQAPLSVGLSGQEYWSGLSFHPPGGLPDPGIDSASLMSPALGGRFFTTTDTWEAALKLQWLRKGKIRFCGGVKWPPSGQSHSDGSKHLSYGGQSDPLRNPKLVFFSFLFFSFFVQFRWLSGHLLKVHK